MKRPNRKHREFLQKINILVEQHDDGVLFRTLAYLPRVEQATRSSGYYGSVKVTMTNGHEILEIYRFHNKSCYLNNCLAIRAAIVGVLRYNRRGK
jgi:hypothetical protein